jgi:hypothetical protein
MIDPTNEKVLPLNANKDMKLRGFDVSYEKSPNSDNWITNLVNTFVSPYGIENLGVRSKTLKDGAKISLFGWAHWNIYEEKWEIAKPIQIAAEKVTSFKEVLIDEYIWKKFLETLKLGYKSFLLVMGVTAIGWVGYRWLKRYR